MELRHSILSYQSILFKLHDIYSFTGPVPDTNSQGHLYGLSRLLFMNIQLAGHSFNQVLKSSVRPIFLIATVSMMLLAVSEDASAKSKKNKDKKEDIKEYVWPAPPLGARD